MVLFYSSRLDGQPITIYAGKDKFENLIRYAWPEDVWVHVDKFRCVAARMTLAHARGSPHVYIRLPEGFAWEKLAGTEVLIDAAQICKAGSIEGNKRDNVTIIFCPASNLKKTGDMDVGTVSFHRDSLVRRIHIAKRDNAIVNRLKKSMTVREVDHEAERLERQRARDKAARATANERKAADLELARQRAADKEARSYTSLRSEEAIAEEAARQRARRDAGEDDDDDDFM